MLKDHRNKLPYWDRMIQEGDDRMSAFASDVVMKGAPEAVFLPENATELGELLTYCHRERLPITFCGNQTSMTGQFRAKKLWQKVF